MSNIEDNTLEIERANLLSLYEDDEIKMFKEIVDTYFANALSESPVIEYVTEVGTDGK